MIVVGGAGPADSLPQFGFESPGLVNGSGDPPPLDLKVGRTYRFRLININPDWRVIFSLTSDSAAGALAAGGEGRGGPAAVAAAPGRRGC